MTRRQILLALLPPLFFGTGFTIAKPAVAHFPPLFMMLMVYGGIAVALAITHRERLRTPLPWIIAISACAVTIQGALLFWGLRGMQATAANLILQIQVPFVVVLGWIVGGEAVVMRKAAGTVIALLGVGIVIGLPEQPPPLWPTLAVIAGGFVWALGQVFASHHGRDTGIGTLKLNAYGSVPQLIAATLLLEQGQVNAVLTATWIEWSMLAFVGIVGFHAAYMVWFTLLRQCKVDEVAPFILLMPVVGILTASLVLGESISLAQVAGGAVILAGLGIVSGFGTAGKKEGRVLDPAS